MRMLDDMRIMIGVRWHYLFGSSGIAADDLSSVGRHKVLVICAQFAQMKF